MKPVQELIQSLDTSSEVVKQVLESVLCIGNFLNEGTYKGNARGFHLKSLTKVHTQEIDPYHFLFHR